MQASDSYGPPNSALITSSRAVAAPTGRLLLPQGVRQLGQHRLAAHERRPPEHRPHPRWRAFTSRSQGRHILWLADNL
ncbi:hypothetical protein [Nonomuraea dietziae]|uniref:hypothetical protein n=1 Tax=Nonomuraea dietziae TaxID=65515 RepID=UPI0033CCA3E9